jgi:hypothetical protein
MRNFQLKPVNNKTFRALSMVLGLCCAFSGRMMLAQVDQGAITGIVKDVTGAAIPNATVSLTNTDTNFVLRAKSSGRGEYVFSPIKIGSYTVSAGATGFETTTQDNVKVNIQDRLSIDLILKPGSAETTVVVTALPPMLQTETSSVGQVMSTDTINATPLNGRNWVYIAQLSSGVVPSFANGTARGGGTGDFSANGQRTTQNNFILDGVDNNVNVDDFQNGASYNIKPPPDALQEFNVSTSDYSAEFGHSAGAVVNASIKSGTNQIHGDLWEYLRNTRFDAADWDSAGGVIPAYHENQFGATFGGPIWKNKIFYFGDAEANRITFAQPAANLTVPTIGERKGDLSELFLTGTQHNGQNVPIGVFAPNTGGQLPLTQAGAIANPGGMTVTANNGQPTTNALAPGNPAIAGGSSGGQMDAVAGEILAAYPKPNAGGWTSANLNTPGAGQTYNNYAVNLPVDDDTWQWDQRLDWNISVKDQAYARYSYTHEQTTFTPPLGPIIDGGNDVGGFHGASNFNLAENFMGSETHVFSPNLVNEIRFGYNWGDFQFVQANAHTPASTLIPGMNGVPFAGYPEANGGLPWMPISGLSAVGARRDVPSVERQNIYQILDNLTKNVGRHSLKFGVQLETIRTSFAQSQYPRGRDSFNGHYSTLYTVTPGPGGPGPNGESDSALGNTGSGIADMWTDNLSNQSLSPGWNTSYYRWYRSFYAQDDWRVNPKLTLNLGVRYDYTQPMNSQSGSVANIVISQKSLTAAGAGTDGGAASGKGSYQLSTKQQNVPNLLAPSFTSLLADQNLSVSYANSLSLVTTQKTNFAPRIGFSYMVDPKTVVRSGYGIFYGGLEAPGGAELEENYPFEYTSTLVNKEWNNYGCFPSINSGANNAKSYCQSNGVPNTVNTPNLPYYGDLEIGLTNYLNNGGIGAYAGSPILSMSDSNEKTPYTESYNLTVERQLSSTLIASLGYVGNVANHTYAGTNPLGPLAVTSNSNGFNTSAFPGIGLNNADQQYIGHSMYNGLQAKFEKRAGGGLSYLATYTWSHAGDNASNPGIGGGPGQRNVNLIPLKYEFTNSNYDVRQRITVNGSYDLPFGSGRKYLHSKGALNYLVGGWSTSLTWTAQTGNPIAITEGGNFKPANGVGINPIRIGDPFKGGGTPSVANPDTGTCPATVKTRANWYNPCAFADPTPGTNLSTSAYLTDLASAFQYSGGKTNQIYGPGYERVNMSAFKNFNTWREQYVQLRGDAFNLFNHPSWNSPSDTSLSLTGGQITGPQQFQNYTPDARFFQIAAKYVF